MYQRQAAANCGNSRKNSLSRGPHSLRCALQFLNSVGNCGFVHLHPSDAELFLRWSVQDVASGARSDIGTAEESRLRTADLLVNLIAILSILSWRIFWITMLNRTRPDAEPSEAFTELDQYLLDELVPDKPNQIRKAPLTHYIIKLARLGGYLARTHDPPPGNTVVWRGLSRLTDIELGIIIGVELV